MDSILTPEVIDLITSNNLILSIADIDKMLVNNSLYHEPHSLTRDIYTPIFSYDFLEEEKKLLKIKKVLIKAYNWYSLFKYVDIT